MDPRGKDGLSILHWDARLVGTRIDGEDGMTVLVEGKHLKCLFETNESN